MALCGVCRGLEIVIGGFRFSVYIGVLGFLWLLGIPQNFMFKGCSILGALESLRDDVQKVGLLAEEIKGVKIHGYPSKGMCEL